MNLSGPIAPPRPRGRGGARAARLRSLSLSLVILAAAASGADARSPVSPAPRAADFLPARAAPVCPVAGGRPGAASAPPAGHQGAEGRTLARQVAETVVAGDGCRPDATVRRYDVAAIAVEMTLNRYLDYDPDGRMYVLEADLPRVRAEEAANAAAREGGGEPAVSLGLQGDAIQPLTLRVLPGDCLRIELRNDLPGEEAASFHLHGSALRVAGTGEPAVATNPRAMARPGETVAYEWQVPPDAPEATHAFHSHGDARLQSGHGLFGAVVVEPAGSTWRDPETGAEIDAGWAATIDVAGGADFREFALYYHEVGDEGYRLLDRSGAFVPQVDPLTGAYRPGARALNYRSEPFLNRLALQEARLGRADESLAYSSYAFGDPATPVLRSYLGDPVKQRVIHGGSEVFHVHHVHGGAVRWRRQPGAEPSGFATGLDKHPPLVPDASERIDSQSLGPGETFDEENECGSGGCQQSAGDFLVHCHVAHHYFAGMWGLWRVYNTLQDGRASTDALPPLAALPDRAGRTRAAVGSEALVGRTVDEAGAPRTIGAPDLAGWVEGQLPPAGVPRGYDASVLDWRWQGDRALGEPETTEAWPGYRADAPGERPAILFDPASGRPAYPFLRPHLGARPPFAPNHGPAPFLDPVTAGTEPPAPGANGPASVCPEGTRLRTLAVEAVPVPVPLNAREGIVDAGGEIFVLREDLDAVVADPARRVPLAVRANAGEDCVDVVLTSRLEDGPANGGFSKVNAHIHFVQFDVQASDGVVAGFNYEQSVRPFALEGTALAAAAGAGATRLAVGDAGRFTPGALVGVGMDAAAPFEVRRVRASEDGALVLDAPLARAHPAGAAVSAEFVRYRWYPDVQFGTAYFHDHVAGLTSWRHGLFGALVAEPPGSTYHDPRSGAPLTSGPLADVHTTGRVSVDVAGSFRELVLFVQDENPPTHIGRSTGGSFNLRAEPLDDRPGDPSLLFSSREHGDPLTPIVEAFVGDPVVFRTLVGGTNEVHTWHLDGHWTRAEPYSATSPPLSTVHLGISERMDLVVPRAGGPQARAGDYLYYNGRPIKLREGGWGLLRVRPPGEAGPRPLPGRAAPEDADGPSETGAPLCPAGAPERRFEVAAVDVRLPILGRQMGKVFVLQADKGAVLAGARRPEPLVLHANVGDCLRVALANETTDGPVSFHVDGLAFDPATSAGVAAGENPAEGQLAAPGRTRTYTFYAHPEVGPTVALVRDWGDVTRNPGLGLYGAVVVAPQGAAIRDPETGADLAGDAGWRAVVEAPGEPARREFTLFLQDEDTSIGTHRMPYTTQVRGAVGLNYAAAPLEDRRDALADPSAAFRPAGEDDPLTPRLEAVAGEPVALHVLAPWSEQAQVFAVEGHTWPLEPGLAGTPHLGAVQLGGLEAITLVLDGGAGGPERLAGDYLYGAHREPYRDAGLWGILRVHASEAPGFEALPAPPLAPPPPPADGEPPGQIGLAAATAACGLAGAIVLRRRRRRRLTPRR